MQYTDLIRNKQITKYNKIYSVQEKDECIEKYYLKNHIMNKKEFAKECNVPYSTFKGWLKQQSIGEQKNYARFKDTIDNLNKQLINEMNQKAIVCLTNGQDSGLIEDELRKDLVKLLEKYFNNENEYTCLIPVKYRNANKKNTLYLFVEKQMDLFKQFYLEQQYQQNRNAN